MQGDDTFLRLIHASADHHPGLQARPSSLEGGQSFGSVPLSKGDRQSEVRAMQGDDTFLRLIHACACHPPGSAGRAS